MDKKGDSVENKSQVVNELNFVKLSENAFEPKKATNGSAGYDLHACIEKDVVLNPGERAFIPCGIAISLPSQDYVALMFGRSGLAAKHGITLANSVGVIDSDYRGELKAILCNFGTEAYTIHPGDRICQISIMKVENLKPVQVGELDSTNRGSGGFGSTGK